MLRLLEIGNTLPFSWPVDPNSEFQPGQLAQLITSGGGNQILCTVSDGTAPIGIIDDVKTHAFTAPSINESIEVTIDNPAISNGRLVVPTDITAILQNPNILDRSFTSNVDVELTPRNGVIIIPAGTLLNLDKAGTGEPDTVRVVVSYSYQVPNVPGDDSTFGSGRVTVWFNRFIGATDQYETNVPYALGANLFCSEIGLFTTRQPTLAHPPVGIVTAPPVLINNSLQFLFL